MKFCKIPVIIEAVQLRWDNWDEMCAFADVGKLSAGKPQGCFVGPDGKPLPDDKWSDVMGLLIPTLEGVLLAWERDWVIKGIKGELYPCKPDIFKATYEPVS